MSMRFSTGVALFCVLLGACSADHGFKCEQGNEESCPDGYVCGAGDRCVKNETGSASSGGVSTSSSESASSSSASASSSSSSSGVCGDRVCLTCEQARMFGASSDGDYAIDPDGPDGSSPPFTVYCADMASEAPQTFLTLLHPDENYSEWAARPSCSCDNYRRTFQKVRLHIHPGNQRQLPVFDVATEDTRFSNVTEFLQQCYGNDMNCEIPANEEAWATVFSCGNVEATSKINLQDTPFIVSNYVRFGPSGTGVVGNVDVVDSDRMTITASGNCGGFGGLDIFADDRLPEIYAYPGLGSVPLCLRDSGCAELHVSSPSSWSVVPPASPVANTPGAAAAAELPDGRIVTAFDPDDLARVVIYDPRTRKWTRPLRPHPNPRPGARLVSHEGAVYAVGGGTSVELYDPDFDVWIPLDPLPVSVDNPAVTSAEDAIYIFDGAVTVRLAPTEMPQSEQRAASPNSVTNAAAAEAADGRILLIGGGTGGTDTTSYVQSYRPSTNSWLVEDGLQLRASRRDHAAVLAPDGRIYVIGGRRGDNMGGFAVLDDVEALNTTLNRSMTVARMPSARALHSAVRLWATTDNLLVLPGEATDGSTVSTVLSYGPRLALNMADDDDTILPSGTLTVHGSGFHRGDVMLTTDPPNGASASAELPTTTPPSPGTFDVDLVHQNAATGWYAVSATDRWSGYTVRAEYLICGDSSSRMSDPRNCGACGHDCGEATCADGLCAPTDMFSQAAGMVRLEIDRQNLLFGTGDNDVLSVRRDQPTTGSAGVAPGRFAAFESDSQHIYAVRADSTEIRRTLSAGSGTTESFADPFPDGGVHKPVDLDVDSEHVYVVDETGGHIFRASKADAGVALVATGRNNPRAVEVSYDTIYWIEAMSVQSVPRANPSTSPAEVSSMGHGNVMATEGFAYDPYQHALVTTAGSSVVVQPLPSGQRSTLYEDAANSVSWLTLDEDGIYWLTVDPGRVMKWDRRTTESYVLATTTPFPDGIAADDTYVYWMANVDMDNRSIWRVHK